MPLFKAQIYQHHAGVWFLCQSFGETTIGDQRPSLGPVEHPSAEGAAELAVDQAINLKTFKVNGIGPVMVRIILRLLRLPGESAPFDLLMYDTHVGLRREPLVHMPSASAGDMKIMSSFFNKQEAIEAPVVHLLSADGSGEAWCGAWIADEQARADHPMGGTPEAAACVTCPKCLSRRLVHLEELAIVGRHLALLRSKGWSVAVHNDYKLNGQSYTFWLFTKGERAWKGEGRTDLEALQQIVDRLPGEMAPPPARRSTFAAEVEANGRLATQAQAIIDAAPQRLEAPPPWAGVHILDSKDVWLRIAADAASRAEANARAAGEQLTKEHQATGLAEAVRVGIINAMQTAETMVGKEKETVPDHLTLDKLLEDMRWNLHIGIRMSTQHVIDALAVVGARLDRIESTLRIRRSG